MAVEVLKSSYPMVYGMNLRYSMYQLAQFFHASNHFNIIDSYASNFGRYKGDPLDTPFWSALDIGDNCWIVIECQTSIHSGLGTTLPKWQAKIEIHDYNYAYDPSDPTDTIYGGTSYWRRAIRSRLCPWGGWDSADSLPDFRPQGKPYPASSNNGGWALNHGGSGNDTRWYIVADTGGLFTFHRRNQSAYDLMGLGCYLGDMRPTVPNVWPNPRVHFPMGDFSVVPLQGVGNNSLLAEESYTNTYGRMDIPSEDDDGTWISGSYRVPTGWLIMQSGLGQPNSNSLTGEIDSFPFMPIPTVRRGVVGDIPMIRKGYGVGYTLVSNKQWVSTGYGYGVILKWDGSTPLY